MGPVESIWRCQGGVVIDVVGLTRRTLIYTAGFPPCACLPDWASGAIREDMFAGLLIELCIARVGTERMLRALHRWAVPLASALAAATLALGLDYSDGINALEAMLRHLVRLVG